MAPRFHEGQTENIFCLKLPTFLCSVYVNDISSHLGNQVKVLNNLWPLSILYFLYPVSCHGLPTEHFQTGFPASNLFLLHPTARTLFLKLWLMLLIAKKKKPKYTFPPISYEIAYTPQNSTQGFPQFGPESPTASCFNYTQDLTDRGDWVITLSGLCHWQNCSHFPREGSTSHHTGPHGKVPGSVTAVRQEHGPDPSLWFLWEGTGKTVGKCG